MATTKIVRSFFPGCRVEAVYAFEEALEWAAKQDWHVILLDELLLGPHPGEAILNLRRRTPASAIIIAAGHQNTAAALELVQQNADYCLFKQSAPFLTELPLVIREILEKHDLKSRLDLSQERYLRLIENLVDMVYELDAEGRFLYISQAVQTLLHYEANELIGRHYTVLIAGEHIPLAERRFNERRSEARATKRFKLRLKDKDEVAPGQEVEVSASGLYDRQRRFKGTVGVIHSKRARVGTPEHRASLSALLPEILSTVQRVLVLVQHLREPRGVQEIAPEAPRPPEKTEAPDATQGAAGVPHDEPAPFKTERRRFPRLERVLDGRLTSGDTTYEAPVLNIGVGGLYVAAKGHASAAEGQTAILSLTSEVGVLEISGTVRSRREAGSERRGGQATIPVTGIAIQFVHRDEIESRILQSLIEGLRTRSLVVRVAVLLISAGSTRAQGEQADEGPRGSSIQEGGERAPLQDRRQASRVRVDAAARVEFVPDLPSPLQDSRLVNLSTGGACLRLKGSAALVGRPCTVTFGTAPSDESANRGVPVEQRVRGEVVWVSTDPETAPGGRNWVRLGMRFTDEVVRGGAAALIRRYVAAREPAAFGGIVSESLECRNERGQRLVLSYDHSTQPQAPGTPIAIVAPGFGQTKTDSIPLAYTFVAHGFSAIRYDHGNHMGESDGGMVSTTLSAMKQDLGSVIRFVGDRWPVRPLVLVAPDLTGRAALRLFTCPMPVKLLVLLAPTIDMPAALLAAHHEDLISAALQGRKRGISNVLGFNIDADEWLNDALIERYAEVQSAQDDAASVQTDTMIVLAQDDAWTQRHAWTRVKEALGPRAVDSQFLTAGVRQLYENAPSTPEVLDRLVARCRSRLFPADRAPDVLLPSKEMIDRQVRLELERLRLHQQKARANHIDFWRDYLDRSHYLVNFSDYWHLLDQIYRLLGPLPEGARVLDAGCGNGNFGMFLLIAQCLRQDQHEPAKALRYIGVDFVLSGLTQAKAHLLRVAAELRGKFSGIVRPHTAMAAGLACADLNVRLPFRDNHFDRVVCTLVLGYLRDPLFTLRELLRVLAPHGKLVIANFKPHADLSQVYRNFATATRDSRELEKAKQMLDASGQLAECAGQGGFRSFDRQELAMLLMTAGASQPRLYSTFANQAYLAVAEKA